MVFEPQPPFGAFPAWIEQLIAESLGKDGRGILPVTDGTPPPASDRLPFVIGLEGAESSQQPSVTMTLDDAYDLGAAMYILEMATAAAGAVIEVHPFDQPDVQLAKSLAHAAMTDGIEGFEVDEWSLDSDETADRLKILLSAAGPGDYVAIQAYLQPSRATIQGLGALADAIAEGTGAIVTIGIGPRFLHSTGQFHKGGPDGGVFLQIVDHPKNDIGVPEADFTFGELITAQSFGDQAALKDRGRPVGRVCLGDAGAADLPRLKASDHSSADRDRTISRCDPGVRQHGLSRTADRATSSGTPCNPAALRHMPGVLLEEVRGGNRLPRDLRRSR